MPIDAPADEMSVKLTRTDYRCGFALPGFRPCGHAMLQVHASERFLEEARRAGVHVTDGELLCVAGATCGIRNAARFMGLLGIMR